MQNSLVSRREIGSFIPQKDPIVMVDTIEEVSEKITRTTLQIRQDNIFVENGFLREPGIIENIAQTAAARAGYEVKMKGAEPLIGFIGAVKDLRIHSLPQAGQVLETTVTIKNEVMGVTIVDGVSTCNGRSIAECEMKIFIRQPES